MAEPPSSNRRRRFSLRRRIPKRPKLALVTPWPPEWSGVGDYNLQLVSALAALVDVDVITAKPIAEYPAPPEPGVRLVPAAQRDVLAPRRRYDRIVYCMGNSHFHAHVFDLFCRWPDAVLFHDVQITGFFGSTAGYHRPADPASWLAERIEELYGAPPEAGSAGVNCMTRGIQRDAKACYVHSDYALAMLEGDRSRQLRHAPAGQLPYAFPAVGEDAKPRGEAAEAPMVVSLGAVAEVRGTTELIDAFALVARKHPRARLVLAGAPATEADATRWSQYAGEHAPGANIEFTGRVSSERYAALLREADVGVALRQLSNGEASGTTADCMAAGLPTMVTELGWAGELPAEAVLRVPLAAEPALIAERLDELIADRARRTGLSAAALDHARTHGFSQAAGAYVEALGLA
jgi:glycosyltransferase involved in cell wall biosynthesis